MAKLSDCTLGNLLLGEQPCGGVTPVVVVSFDQNADGNAETGLANRTQSLSIARGIEPATGRPQGGTATAALNNSDGRFSPRYTSSPLYPNVLPGRAFKVERQNASGTLHPQYFGYLETPSADPDLSVRQAGFECLDLIDRLRGVKVSTPLYEGYRSDQLISAILALAGWTGSTSLETGAKSFAYASWRNVAALDAIQQVVDSELGAFFVSAAGVPTFHARYHRVTTTSNESTFTNPARLRYSLPKTDIFNEAALTIYPRVVGSVGELWRWQEVPYFLAAGASITLEAEYTDPDLGGACQATDVVTPVATTDYTANTLSDGSGTDKTAQLAIVFTEYGDFAELAVTNNDAAAVYVTLLKLRGAPITVPNALTVRETNADSITEYGFTRTLTIDQPLETLADAARDAAAYLVALYGDPLDRVSLTVKPADTAQKNAIATLDLNDRLALTSTILGLSTTGFFVDHINVRMERHPNSYEVTYEAQRAPDGLDLIILDSLTQTFASLLGY